MRSVVKRAAAAAATMAAALALAAPAPAFELRSFDVELTDPGTVANPTPGAPQLAAGAHPDVQFDLQFPTREIAPGVLDPTESVKDVDVDLPPGLVFDPTAVPRCTAQQLSIDFGAYCPLASQIGTAWVGLSGFEQAFPIYNIVPPPGVPSQFGFNVVKTTIKLNGKVRSDGDYGLSAEVRGISQALPLTGTRIVLWGVPADPVHDAERNTLKPDGTMITGPANIPVRTLISNPGRCTGEPLRFTADATSWPSPNASSPRTTTTQRGTDEPLLITGCESLPFEATAQVRPTTAAANSPSGLDVTIAVPQSDSPVLPAAAHLKDATILLPEGMTVNPSSADGLAACSPAQFGLRNGGAESCPNASVLGSVAIDTPLLEQPLRGRAYLASQRDNPFGTTLAMYLAAAGDGVSIKLAGRIDPDPVTGRLRVTFTDNPQLPFDTLRVSLDGGPRAPLSTPSQCGPATATTTLTPWSGGPAVVSGSTFEITQSPTGGPCAPRGFAPSFTAGTQNAAAGASSTFSLTFGRGDGDQYLNDVTVQMPPGVTGVLASVNECAEALAAAGACGEDSRIGSVATTAGAGSNPLHLPGRGVYMTGPYKGAPLGLSIVVPAVAGPFDLGTVAVRAALFVDRHDASLRVVSDPLPTILEGIPLQIRTVDVRIDKPGFMLNPTNCSAKTMGGRVTSTSGAAADRSSRFQVGSCRALPLDPRIGLRVGARGRTRPRMTVPLQAVVRMGAGQSNLRSVRVNLPRNINARLPVINANSCSQAEYDAGRCPASRAIGTATAVTPLLKRPLSGDVFFVRNPARRIPDLVMALRGQIAIDVVGRVSIPRNLSLATTFDTIPDVPISSFTLNLRAGRSGPIGTVGNLCHARVRRGMRAKVGYRGQNGKPLSRTRRVAIDGCARTVRDRAGARRAQRRARARRDAGARGRARGRARQRRSARR